MRRAVQEYKTVVSTVTYKCNNMECPKTADHQSTEYILN
jgi:hypothetical protein